MGKIFRSILTWISLFLAIIMFQGTSFAWSISDLLWNNPSTSWNICTSWECTFDWWIDAVKDRVDWIEKEKTFDKYVQDIVTYLLWFLYLLAVIMIIYAWYLLLLSAWTGPEAMWHAKNNVVVVIAWIVIVFLADSVVNFIITWLSQ